MTKPIQEPITKEKRLFLGEMSIPKPNKPMIMAQMRPQGPLFSELKNKYSFILFKIQIIKYLREITNILF